MRAMVQWAEVGFCILKTSSFKGKQLTQGGPFGRLSFTLVLFTWMIQNEWEKQLFCWRHCSLLEEEAQSGGSLYDLYLKLASTTGVLSVCFLLQRDHEQNQFFLWTFCVRVFQVCHVPETNQSLQLL